MRYDFSELMGRLKAVNFSGNEVDDFLGFGESYKEAVDAYNNQTRIIEKYLTNVYHIDTTNLLIIYGDPGIGKTFAVRSVIDGKLGIRNKYIRAKETATELYKNAYEYRNKNDTIILDDCDSIFDDPVQMNLIKAMTDSYPVRKVTYDSSFMNGVPKEFEYAGKVIILTNRKVNSNPDYDALISRAFSTTMSVNYFQKVCKSMDILIHKKDYRKDVDDIRRVWFICRFLWGNMKHFANEDYSLRTGDQIINNLKMLEDDIGMFVKEVQKMKVFKE